MVIFYVFLSIIIVFYLGLVIKSRVSLNFCTICIGVSTTWIGLLILRELNLVNQNELLALLIGESVVGGYYLIEKKVNDDLLIFRLPTLITMSYVALVIILKSIIWQPILLLLTIWLLHLFMYYYRNNKNIKYKVDKLIACCSKW